MKNVVVNKLRELEQTENIRVLLAVESGSRAWGFASPDSDYDVRFIYVRPKEDYLRLEKVRDVLELPLDGVFDISGWDISKTLRLLYRSNPSLFEWFNSPIVYLETECSRELKNAVNSCFSSKKGLYHYLSMAYNNNREFLQSDMVKAKKYFYVLRPILACKWILEKNSPPPVLFSELAEAELDPFVRPEVERLLDIKVNQPELKLIPRVEILNEYLENEIREIEEAVKKMPECSANSWDELNSFFRKTVGF